MTAKDTERQEPAAAAHCEKWQFLWRIKRRRLALSQSSLNLRVSPEFRPRIVETRKTAGVKKKSLLPPPQASGICGRTVTTVVGAERSLLPAHPVRGSHVLIGTELSAGVGLGGCTLVPRAPWLAGPEFYGPGTHAKCTVGSVHL